MEFQGSSGESERASWCSLGDFSKRKSCPSHLSCPPTPLVVVPDLSRSVLLCEKSSQQNSEGMVEDPHGSDSAPSDDENDADDLGHLDIEDEGVFISQGASARLWTVTQNSASVRSLRTFSIGTR